MDWRDSGELPVLEGRLVQGLISFFLLSNDCSKRSHHGPLSLPEKTPKAKHLFYCQHPQLSLVKSSVQTFPNAMGTMP